MCCLSRLASLGFSQLLWKLPTLNLSTHSPIRHFLSRGEKSSHLTGTSRGRINYSSPFWGANLVPRERSAINHGGSLPHPPPPVRRNE